MDNDKKKYNGMEALLQQINKDFISLSEEDKRTNNKILESLRTLITQKMADKDSLFKAMYSITFYGGSYYDGLKVASPDEFDLDLLLTLPSDLETRLTVASNVPGFVTLKFLNFSPSIQKLDLNGKLKDAERRNRAYSATNTRPQSQRSRVAKKKKGRGLDKLINTNHYLDTSKVLQWMQKVIQLALNSFAKDPIGRYVLQIPYGTFYVNISNSGPAFTLKASGNAGGKQINLDVDLVPCFVFSKDRWPQSAFRPNPVDQKPNFLIVPKPIKGMANSNHYWRLSFQEQERVLLDKKEKLKPTIKLLKKMRDLLQHKAIASYYIKTVALLTIDEKDASFWHSSLSYVFMTVLKKYQTCLETGKIPYYWNKQYNLLGSVNQRTLTNISNKVKAIIDDMDRHLDNPRVVAKYLVTPQESLTLQSRYGL